MALLTEQPVSCLPDWLAYDSKLAILSAQESASIEKKAELAQQEIQTEVLAFLLRNAGSSEAYSRSLVDQVFVSEPLKRWHVSLTLSLYYADMASLQASQLHKEQSHYYLGRCEEARDQTFVTGLGIVQNPVPRGKAPEVAISGQEDEQRLVRGRVRFVGATGVEGTPSEEFVVRMPVVGTASLEILDWPDGAEGWRLYLAEDTERFRATRELLYGPSEVLNLAVDFELTGNWLSPKHQQPSQYIYLARTLGR